jgi:GlpG protein
VTFAVAAMAIFVTVAVKTDRTDIDPFTMSSLAFESEPWRLASSALPHGNWIHLAFNVIWLWVLGTRLEEVLGHVTTFAIFVVLAVGSEAAEYGFAAGGIGLSGVGYGLVGALWILAKRDARFRDAIDRTVLITFIAWGLLCIAFTVSGVMNIGNIAHGSGFVLGVVIAYAIAPGSAGRRVGAAVLLAGLVGGLVAAAGWARPQINLSGYAGQDDKVRAYNALGEREYELAARHLRRAIALDANDATVWYNYGVALQHVTDPDGMTQLDAWQRAYALQPNEPQFRDTLAREYVRTADEARQRGDVTRAGELIKRAEALGVPTGEGSASGSN